MRMLGAHRCTCRMELETFVFQVFVVNLTLVVVLILRVWWVIARSGCSPSRQTPVKAVIVVGSGGHTSEMMHLVRHMSAMYRPRVYVIAATDTLSANEVRALENDSRSTSGIKQDKTFEIINELPRSREVGQSYISSVFTTIRAAWFCFPLMFKQRPDLILCNGPGTCIPLCAAAFLMKILGVKNVTIVYVESICRVESLSLSGKILYYFADHFFVQWEKLQTRYPKAIYRGRLV